jgi:hypothetical protein
VANLRYNPLLATATTAWQVYHQTYHETNPIDWPEQCHAYVPPTDFGETLIPSSGWEDGLKIASVELNFEVSETTFGTINVLDTNDTIIGTVEDTWQISTPYNLNIPVNMGSYDLSRIVFELDQGIPNVSEVCATERTCTQTSDATWPGSLDLSSFNKLTGDQGNSPWTETLSQLFLGSGQVLSEIEQGVPNAIPCRRLSVTYYLRMPFPSPLYTVTYNNDINTTTQPLYGLFESVVVSSIDESYELYAEDVRYKLSNEPYEYIYLQSKIGHVNSQPSSTEYSFIVNLTGDLSTSQIGTLFIQDVSTEEYLYRDFSLVQQGNQIRLTFSKSELTIDGQLRIGLMYPLSSGITGVGCMSLEEIFVPEPT